VLKPNFRKSSPYFEFGSESGSSFSLHQKETLAVMNRDTSTIEYEKFLVFAVLVDSFK